MLCFSIELIVYILLMTFSLGLIFGSFSNCLAWRIAHHESINHGRSHCAKCNHTLSPLDLVPVLSWLFLRGRCRYCHEKISIRYPLTELVCGAAFVGLVLRCGISFQTLEYMALVVILLAVAMVDLETGFIPDRLLIAGAVNFVLFSILIPIFEGGSILSALVSGLLGSLAIFAPLFILVLIMDRVLGRESMGGGDLKLYFMIGLYFSWKCNLFLVLLSCLTGIAFFLVFRNVRLGEDERAFPFGPAIAAAAYVSLLAAEPAVAWYFGLF